MALPPVAQTATPVEQGGRQVSGCRFLIHECCQLVDVTTDVLLKKQGGPNRLTEKKGVLTPF
jgi:hypothetical protein